MRRADRGAFQQGRRDFRLVIPDIQRDAGQHAAIQRQQQRLLVRHLAPGRVEEAGPGLEVLEKMAAGQALRGEGSSAGQWHVQGDGIRLLKHAVEV